MERIFDINLSVKKGTPLSDFCEQVTENHHGVGWSFFVGAWNSETPWISLHCMEQYARRHPLGSLVETDCEFEMQLADRKFIVAQESWKFSEDSYEVTLKEDLAKELMEHIVHSDAIFNARVKIKRTIGCRCDTLENFDEPKAFWTDRRVMVEGKQFHVNQRYLASKSPIFEKIFTDNSSKDIIIDNTNSDAFENFLQVVHKKLPSLPVPLIPQIIELANRFEIGQVKEYCEWYLKECGVFYLVMATKYERGIYNAVMKTVFPKCEPISPKESSFDLASRLKLHLSTMKENHRKPESCVIPLKMVEFCKGCSEEKKFDFFGLRWIASISFHNGSYYCFLQCDEGYREDYGDPNYGPDMPGWCVTVDVKVFAWFGEEKILVGNEENEEYTAILEVVEVELSDEFEWHTMSAADVRFEVHVEIVKAAGTRHLTFEDFSKEKKGWTDGCLVVQGRQFHINKKDLARNSAFFADIFKKKPFIWQFNLDKEDPDLFELFLQIAHSGSSFIKQNDILGMIDLAKRYKSKILMEACRSSVTHYFISYGSDISDFTEIMEQMDCTDMWEVRVEYPLLEKIDENFVGHQGLNAMFPKLLELKSKDLCWPIFIDSGSGEVYILEWSLKSTLEALIKTVARIENKPINSQKLMIDGVFVKHENDITAHFQRPFECPKITYIPDVYKDLIDGTAEELGPELLADFEQFLLGCSELGVKKRLLLADKYSLQKLLKRCLAEITTLRQMNQLSDCYPNLSLPVKLKLYKEADKDRFDRKYSATDTYKPRRFPCFNVEFDSEDTGDSIAKSIGLIRGLPPSQEDVIDFNDQRCREKIKYNAWEVLRIDSINTDGIQE